MALFIRAALLAALLCPVVSAAGLASDDNFSVLTPAVPSQDEGQRYAESLLLKAEQFRSEVAREWLGEELPTGTGQSLISVKFSTTENSALTWAKDSPTRKYHNVYLRTSPEKASGCMLHHEIAHTVLATRFPEPNRLPPWAEEGIASRYDDRSLVEVRQQEVMHWSRSGQVPRLMGLLDTPKIAALDATGYAGAESLVAFLTTRGDKLTVVRFAAMGKQYGWDAALQSCYGMASVAELQIEWQNWLTAAAYHS